MLFALFRDIHTLLKKYVYFGSCTRPIGQCWVYKEPGLFLLWRHLPLAVKVSGVEAHFLQPHDLSDISAPLIIFRICLYSIRPRFDFQNYFPCHDLGGNHPQGCQLWLANCAPNRHFVWLHSAQLAHQHMTTLIAVSG